jgi:hypothetical protein
MIETEIPKPKPRKRKRRWFQFSLRSVLILVTIVSVQCAVCLPMVREWQRRRAIFQKLAAIGAAFENYPPLSRRTSLTRRNGNAAVFNSASGR